MTNIKLLKTSFEILKFDKLDKVQIFVDFYLSKFEKMYISIVYC